MVVPHWVNYNVEVLRLGDTREWWTYGVNTDITHTWHDEVRRCGVHVDDRRVS